MEAAGPAETSIATYTVPQGDMSEPCSLKYLLLYALQISGTGYLWPR